jgi:hypothetical protein
MEGKLVCGNCQHEYAIKEGIPNFLLPNHLGAWILSCLGSAAGELTVLSLTRYISWLKAASFCGGIFSGSLSNVVRRFPLVFSMACTYICTAVLSGP